jgi:hypothetical protein
MDAVIGLGPRCIGIPALSCRSSLFDRSQVAGQVGRRRLEAFLHDTKKFEVGLYKVLVRFRSRYPMCPSPPDRQRQMREQSNGCVSMPPNWHGASVFNSKM